MDTATKRPFLLARGWIQAVLLVTLFGFFVLGILAYNTYTGKPPIPGGVVDPGGRLLFTRGDIMAGQGVFLENGLMEYGSIFGHGAYLGPDFTADYLHRAALLVIDAYGGQASDQARSRAAADFKTNRYDAATDTLTLSAAQAGAFDALLTYYRAFFGEPTSKNGLRPSAIVDPTDVRNLTAFFAWSAWCAGASRPGHNYSYTNNWPPEPLVGNQPTADNVVWSVLSLIALLGGIGLTLAAFGRWDFLGWHGREHDKISFRPPGEVTLTPAQRSCAWFFLVMVVLFLLQTLLGGATEHYRADLSSFFGIDLSRLPPFNVARTWRLQLAIFWVATGFLAAGIFLAPIISGSEPRGQHWLAYGLLAALAIVVFGSLIGEFISIHGWMRNLWAWFGSQGFEYLDLGRFWQILLTVGLFFWVLILFRGLRYRLRGEHLGNMPWLFFFSALTIPVFYGVGLLARPNSHFTATDFWRFWVYFSGEPAMHMALGAFFSAAEVIPLTILTFEAWSFVQLGARQESKSQTPFPHFWAVMFLASVGFWNFLGAGIFGFLINLPIVSYYEIGTALMANHGANHGHAAMMGVYGMLSVGLALFCQRYMIPESRWSDRAAKISFWSLNLGLAWMVFATLFPIGILQLYHAVSTGYFDARTLHYITGGANPVLEWLRLPGDVVFIVGGGCRFCIYPGSATATRRRERFRKSQKTCCLPKSWSGLRRAEGANDGHRSAIGDRLRGVAGRGCFRPRNHGAPRPPSLGTVARGRIPVPAGA